MCRGTVPFVANFRERCIRRRKRDAQRRIQFHRRVPQCQKRELLDSFLESRRGDNRQQEKYLCEFAWAMDIDQIRGPYSWLSFEKASQAQIKIICQYRRQTCTRRERPTKKTAITRLELEAMQATRDSSLEGLRDPALPCFGFASGRRRHSELAAAALCNLRKTGDEGYIYRLEYSKTQQAKVKADSTPDKPILGHGALALSAWLEVARIHEGDFSDDLDGSGGPCPPPGLNGGDRQTMGRIGGIGGGLWGTQRRVGFVTEVGKQTTPRISPVRAPWWRPDLNQTVSTKPGAVHFDQSISAQQ